MLKKIFTYILVINFFNIALFQYTKFDDERLNNVMKLVLNEHSDTEGEVEGESEKGEEEAKKEKSDPIEETESKNEYLAIVPGHLFHLPLIEEALHGENRYSQYPQFSIQTISPPPEVL